MDFDGSETRVVTVGFGKRLLALLIDSLLWTLLTAPILLYVYGYSYFNVGAFHGWVDLTLNQLAPAIVVIWFWTGFGATPGKLVFHAVVVDAQTLGPLTVSQAIIRYLGYIPSTLVLGLGFIWAAFDERHQAWHDKLAGTLVICSKQNSRP